MDNIANMDLVMKKIGEKSVCYNWKFVITEFVLTEFHCTCSCYLLSSFNLNDYESLAQQSFENMLVLW